LLTAFHLASTGLQEKRVEFYKIIDAAFPPDDSELGPHS
jgi:hypothetical protein